MKVMPTHAIYFRKNDFKNKFYIFFFYREFFHN